MNSYRLKSLVTCPIEKSDGELLPFVGLEDVGSGTGVLATDELPMKAALDSVLHRPGDVLFSKLRPYLAKSFMPTMPGSATGELLVLRPGREIDGRFLLYSTLSSPWLEWAETTSYGTKMPRTSWEAMSEYRLFLPSLDEQRRIADFLDAETARIDRLDGLASQAADLLAERSRALIEQVIIRSNAPSSKLFRNLRVLRDGTHQPPPRTAKGVPLLTARNVSSGILRLTEQDTFVSSEDAGILEKSLKPRPQDVLLSVKGTVGAVVMVPANFPRAVLDRNLALLRPQDSLISEWLVRVLRTRSLQDQMRLAVAAAAQPGLPLSTIRELRIPTVDISGQKAQLKEIEAIEGPLIDLESKIRNQRDLLAERRQALITAAVTGGITV